MGTLVAPAPAPGLVGAAALAAAPWPISDPYGPPGREARRGRAGRPPDGLDTRRCVRLAVRLSCNCMIAHVRLVTPAPLPEPPGF